MERVVERQSLRPHPEVPAEGDPRRVTKQHSRPSKDDGQKVRANRKRHRDAERIGQPAMARREQRRGRGPQRGKKR
jgi:hypothetical protein